MMSNNLTVAICAYNAEKYIAETLECILKQTFKEFDLLIVNDCSTDSTVSVIDQFFINSPTYEYKIEHFNKNCGLAAGRRYVECNVNTKYLIFIDADDAPYPTLIEELYNKIIQDSNLMAVGCFHSFIDSKSKAIRGGIYLGSTSKDDFYNKASRGKLIFMQPTAIVDRECLLKVGGRNIVGFPNGKPRYADLCEDLDLWCRMSDLYVEGKAIVVIPKVLSRYRKHEGALSSSSLDMRIRMKHIKNNLKRRRAGESDLTFIEFYNTLSKDEFILMKRECAVGDTLRNGVIKLWGGNIFIGGYLVIKAIIMNPKYFWQKIKANSGLINRDYGK